MYNMNNKETISEIRERTESVLNKVENESLQREFKVSDIKIKEDQIFLGDTIFADRAKSKILSILKVKRNFSDYAKQMEPGDWRSVSEKIKTSQGDTSLIAQYNDKGCIVDMFNKNINKKRPDDMRLRNYVDMICESLSETDQPYSLKDMLFLPQHQQMDISLLNRDADIDIFGNGRDVWHGGTSFTFNELDFRTMPFFERLVCSNGMRSRQNGFVSDIRQTRFNVEKIAYEIRKSINEGGKIHNEMLSAAANHLRTNNASITEFEKFRNFFIKRGGEDNPMYQKIIEQYFDDKPFYNAYGVNIANQSEKWKSTANSGMNAYDLFNLQTWIASHEKESGISATDAIDLQIGASSFFFKNRLDLEDVAQPKSFEYPRFSVVL